MQVAISGIDVETELSLWRRNGGQVVKDRDGYRVEEQAVREGRYS